MIHAMLRQATERDHAAVEGSVNLLSPALTRQEYVETMVRMSGFVRAWELFAESAASPSLQAFVRARSRLFLLERDINHLLGHLPTCPAPTLPACSSSSEFLGALYVMEGSRLGGQFIARHVDEVLQLGGQGTAYFRGFEEKTGSMWKDLLQVLDEHVPDLEAELAISAAQRMFHAFGEWMSNNPAAVAHVVPALLEVSNDV